MTRTLDALIEDRAERHKKALLRSVYGGLDAAIQNSGGQLERISVRMNGVDTLLTMCATFPGGPMVCHVGSEDLAGCFVRAAREASRESLSWKRDKYRANGG